MLEMDTFRHHTVFIHFNHCSNNSKYSIVLHQIFQCMTISVKESLIHKYMKISFTSTVHKISFTNT